MLAEISLKHVKGLAGQSSPSPVEGANGFEGVGVDLGELGDERVDIGGIAQRLVAGAQRLGDGACQVGELRQRQVRTDALRM